MSRVAGIGLLAILACRSAEKAPEPPPAPVIVKQAAWRALGTEPFWHLDLTAAGLRFTTPDDTVGIVTPPVTPRLEGDTTRWTGVTERTAFDVHIWPGNCSDGMSDRVWPAAALVLIDGKTWQGCAEPLPETHLGDWRVTGHRAPGISAMTPGDAAAWVGRTGEFSRTRARFGTEECRGPSYAAATLSAPAFVAEFGVPPETLELQAPVTTITVACRGDWSVPGSRLLVRGPDRMFAPWDGVFFELERGK